MNTDTRYYRTEYRKTITPRKGAEAGKKVVRRLVYQTKTITPMHSEILRNLGGMLMECDTAVPWPFGVWAEVIAEGTGNGEIKWLRKP